MKLALIEDFRPVAVVDDRFLDLSPVLEEIMPLPGYLRMPALIEGWEGFSDRVREVAADKARASVVRGRLRAPIPRPTKLLCAQLSFREGSACATPAPRFFLKSSTSVVGPGDTVELNPIDAQVFHHEAELAVVIGRRARSVSATEALGHIFGYTCFMDISARGVGQGTGFEDKSYDTFGPMGPWIVTSDEIVDPHSLRVRLWVDDEPRHDYSMTDIANSIPAMIAYAASIASLDPGDVLAMGVNHQGIGPIQDGETIRIEIQSIGGFEVHVRDERKRRWVKGVDHGAATWVKRLIEKEKDLGAPTFARRLDI